MKKVHFSSPIKEETAPLFSPVGIFGSPGAIRVKRTSTVDSTCDMYRQSIPGSSCDNGPTTNGYVLKPT